MMANGKLKNAFCNGPTQKSIIEVSKFVYFFKDFDDTPQGHVSIKKKSVELLLTQSPNLFDL